MICPKCGTENGDSSLKCVKCWRPLQPTEKGPWLGSKPKLPEQTPSKKLSPVRVRRIVSILLVMGVLFSVIVPFLIEKIREYKIQDLKEKARQEAIRPTPVPKEAEAAPAVTNREERGGHPRCPPLSRCEGDEPALFRERIPADRHG